MLKMNLVRLTLIAASLAAIGGKLSALGLADGGL